MESATIKGRPDDFGMKKHPGRRKLFQAACGLKPSRHYQIRCRMFQRNIEPHYEQLILFFRANHHHR